ncbi:unnamed protein product [Durusdinium trenchii]|uniref:Phospholipid/glycerol acyltransferase domain-containing protein n=1 Tax=Durusdinium trenchii TaxID=1381693 RepID=A0ABP0NNX3_9DINO
MANAGQVLARCFAQFLVWGPEGFSFVHCLKHLDVFLRVFVRTIFGCLLATSLIPAWVLCLLLKLVLSCLPVERRAAFERCFGRMLIVILVVLWRMVFTLCAWIRVEVFQQEVPFLGAPGKPAVLVMNHTCFLDAVLATSLAPLNRSSDVRVLVANYVFKIPLLGTVMRVMGLPEVPFKACAGGGETSNMTVEKNLMEERLNAFNDHVRSGGVGAWFPEGLMNRGDPEILQEFRAGAFAVPVKTDVEIWCIAAVGCNVCWPVKAAVGGLPARIGLKVFRLTDSSHKLIEDLKDCDERAKALHIAGLAKSAVQEGVNELVAKGFSANPGMVKRS